MSGALQYLFYWNLKTSDDNQWHPQPGQSPTTPIYPHGAPAFLHRADMEATVVDTAPIVAGVGGFAHLSQIPHFGFTAPASVFRNVQTMTAMHRTVLVVAPLVLTCQAVGLEYRFAIPRWCHPRELRRDEEEVRRHVQVGMAVGGGLWVARLLFRLGTRYWAPIDVVMGGALADLMHREWVKAHEFERG